VRSLRRPVACALLGLAGTAGCDQGAAVAPDQPAASPALDQMKNDMMKNIPRATADKLKKSEAAK